MKRTTIVTLALLLGMSGIAQAQQAGGEQQRLREQETMQNQEREQVYGWQMMSEEERQAYRQKMRQLHTEREREAYRLEHHEMMSERARQMGLTLPETPGPRGQGGMAPGRQGGMGPGGGGRGGGGGGRR